MTWKAGDTDAAPEASGVRDRGRGGRGGGCLRGRGRRRPGLGRLRIAATGPRRQCAGEPGPGAPARLRLRRLARHAVGAVPAGRRGLTGPRRHGARVRGHRAVRLRRDAARGHRVEEPTRSRPLGVQREQHRHLHARRRRSAADRRGGSGQVPGRHRSGDRCRRRRPHPVRPRVPTGAPEQGRRVGAARHHLPVHRGRASADPVQRRGGGDRSRRPVPRHAEVPAVRAQHPAGAWTRAGARAA